MKPLQLNSNDFTKLVDKLMVGPNQHISIDYCYIRGGLPDCLLKIIQKFDSTCFVFKRFLETEESEIVKELSLIKRCGKYCQNIHFMHVTMLSNDCVSLVPYAINGKIVKVT